STDSVSLFCGLLCSICPSDSPSFYSRAADQRIGCQVSQDCLSGSAPYSSELSYQLYPSGYGERPSIGYPYLQPSGASEYSSVDSHEYNCWTLWHDLDPAGSGSDHAASILRHVHAHTERAEKCGK